MLITFGGLPGTGKTTLARRMAQAIPSLYLRIDTIEQALRDQGLLEGDMKAAGYVIAYALAESNLKLGKTVIADSVNPIALTRDAWREVAFGVGAPAIEIEVVCSNIAEHRRRVEARTSDIPGFTPPTWEKVCSRRSDLWRRNHVVIDTAGRSVEDCLVELSASLPPLR